MSTQTKQRKLIIKLNQYSLKKIFYTLILVCLAPSAMKAQDIHYSQFYNAPLNINPALTGVYRGDIRFMGNLRNQWRAVPVDYFSFTAAADMKFYPRGDKNGLFAGGLHFNYDQAGFSKLSLAQLGLSGSYIHRLSNYAFLSLGAQISGNQRGFKIDDLTFDNNFDPDRGVYDPARPSNENFSNTNNFYFDFGAGINLRFQSLHSGELVDRLEKRNKIDVGVAFYHLNRPDQSFFEDTKSKLFMRVSPYVSGTAKVSGNLDLVGNLTGQFQGPYAEILGMLGLKIHMDRTPGKQFALQPGVGYRFDDFGDAYFPGIELFYNNWQAGFTYDVNVSKFKVATNRRGGPEFSIRYIISKPKPLPQFKICPLI